MSENGWDRVPHDGAVAVRVSVTTITQFEFLFADGTIVKGNEPETRYQLCGAWQPSWKPKDGQIPSSEPIAG